VGETTPILDWQQQRRAIGEAHRTRVEHAVGRIGPIGDSQNRILRVSLEKLGMPIAQRSPIVTRELSRRSSRSAWRKASIDSAPWFSLGRSECSPSRQPPVVGS
jgi:hypothetical protein